MKVLANTLLCKMEPSKVRVQDLSLVYYAVRSLVHMEDIEELENDMWPNLGALFAENLVKLKMKSFQGKGNEQGDGREFAYTNFHALRSATRQCCG